MAIFAAPKKQFQEAVRAVCAPVPRKGPRPILKTVNISVNGDVTLSSNNMEEETVIKSQWGHEGEATCLVDAKQLADISRLGSHDVLIVDVTPERIVVNGSTINAYSPKDKDDVIPPSILSRSGPECGGIAIDSQVLKEAIEATEYAADTESTRYALGAIQFEFSDGKLFLVATDSRRLMIADAGYCASLPSNLLVPKTTLVRVAKAIGKSGGAVVIRLHQRRQVDGKGVVSFTDSGGIVRFYLPNGVTIDTLQAEGRFPRWREVIPNQLDKSLSVNAGELVNFCKIAKNMVTDDARGLDLSFSGVDAHSALMEGCLKSDKGVANPSVCIRSNNLEGWEKVTFDVRYLLEFAEHQDKKSKITMQFVEETRCNGGKTIGETPCVLKNEDETVTYVLMPLARDR